MFLLADKRGSGVGEDRQRKEGGGGGRMGDPPKTIPSTRRQSIGEKIYTKPESE